MIATLSLNHSPEPGTRRAPPADSDSPAKRRSVRRHSSAAAIFGIVAALLAGCGKHPTPGAISAAPTLPPVKAQVVAVRAENMPVITEITGTVRPLQRATIAAKVMGVIEELHVTLGQRVRAGDVLLKISAAEIQARVTQAQSQFNAARRDLERERALFTKGATTADTVKGLEDRFAAAQAMVREAEVMQGYVTVRAPFDGVVSRKLAHSGDLAAPGVPLVEIEGVSDFQIEFGLPDSLAQRLTAGTELEVEVPAAALSFNGKLAELSSSADSSARTIPARLTVPPGTAVRSGQFARVHLPGKPVRALLAPAGSVSQVGQLERVFVVSNDNRAVLRLVKTAPSHDARIEILSGLDDGERVVVAPPVGLRDGQPLDLQP